LHYLAKTILEKNQFCFLMNEMKGDFINGGDFGARPEKCLGSNV